MKRGHFRGHFVLIVRGCPVSNDYVLICKDCIYYLDGKCVNYYVIFGNKTTGHYIKKWR